MAQDEDIERQFEAARLRLDDLSKQKCSNAPEQCLFQEALNEISLALEELNRGKNRLQLALKAAKAACWEWDIQADKIFWQGEIQDLKGSEHKCALNPENYWFQKLIHLEDRHKVNLAVKSAVDSGTDYDLEFRVVLPSGDVRWIASKGRVFSDQYGRPAKMIGIDIDITDSKLAELALKETESRQRALLNNIPDMAWLKDAQSRFIAVNEPFARACGLTPEDLVGRSNSDIWPKDLAERHFADDIDVMARRSQKTGEEMLVNRDGKLRWIETVKMPIFNDQDKVIGTTGIARDVTARKRAEEALQASEEMYRSLVEQAAEGILLCRMDGSLLAANAQLCRILGYTIEDLLKMKCMDLVPEEDSMRNPLNLKELESGKNFVMECVLRHKDGREIPVEISGKALQHGQVQTIVRDISGRKKAEEALLRYSEQLETLVAERTEQLKKVERLAVIGETAAMIGHDLRNPLQVLTCMVFLAKERLNSGNLLPQEGQPSLGEILRTMEKSTDYMEKIISVCRSMPGHLGWSWLRPTWRHLSRKPWLA